MSRGTGLEVERILSSIPGAVKIGALDDGQRSRVVELEARHEMRLAVPVRNLGVSLMADRNFCFVILKTAGFRAPPVPTVYMVEEGDGGRDGKGAHVLRIAGRSYSIVGEEVIDGGRRYDEPVIPLEGSFVIFPERRSDPRVPCSFILPPLPFPELEGESAALGIRDIISTSPSLVSDSYLRESFGFPPSNDLATILVGFNLAAP